MSRETVLRAVRDALGGNRPEPAPCPPALRPAFTGTPSERLCERLSAHACSLEEIASLAELPLRVMAWLATHELAPCIALAAPLAALPWPEELRRDSGAATKDVRCAVSLALAGIAETGSLMMCSGPDSPITHNFVPEHHLVVLHADRILAHQEDAWALLRTRGAMPRAVNLIAGPSRTGDVEQTIQIGAHGPRVVHVLLCREDSTMNPRIA